MDETLITVVRPVHGPVRPCAEKRKCACVHMSHRCCVPLSVRMREMARESWLIRERAESAPKVVGTALTATMCPHEDARWLTLTRSLQDEGKRLERMTAQRTEEAARAI